MKLNEKDIRVDSYRNGYESFVKMVHLSTGLMTKTYKNKSEFRARREALKELEFVVEKWMTKDE